MKTTKWSRAKSQAVVVAALALGVATATIFSAVWPALVLAFWLADLTHPVALFLGRAMRGRRRAAGSIAVLVVIALLVPVTIATVTLIASARALFEQFGTGALALTKATTFPASKLALDAPFDLPKIVRLVEQHGASVWGVTARVVGASSDIAVGVVVFLVALYAFALDGRSLFLWFARGRIVDPRTLGRFLHAFRETGRGLLVGMGGTALAQGMVAALAYAILGVENALIFGFLTGVCSFIPVFGAMLVWGPVALSLALNGDTARAIVLVGIGLGVISTIDNILRPWLSRVGHLRLPMIVVFVAMMAGLRLVGPSGILLGPIVVRLAVEAFSFAGEAKMTDRRARAAAGPMDDCAE